MPVFEVSTPDGQEFEVDAPNFDAAVKAIKSGRAEKAGIGYKRALAQGAIIDTPEALGGMVDLLRKLSLPLMAADKLRSSMGGAPPTPIAQMGRQLGEGLIGPRQQGTAGEEMLSRGVRGAMVSAPFAAIGGPLAGAATVLGGAAGDVAQGEAEKRGAGLAGGVGVGAAVDIATGLAARNATKAFRGITALRAAAKPATQEVGEALAKLTAKEATEAAGLKAALPDDVADFSSLYDAPQAPSVIAPAAKEEALELVAKEWNPASVPRRVAVDAALKKRGYMIPENLRIPEAEGAAGLNIDKTIRDVAELSKDRIGELRGGVQTWDMTADLARKTGLTVDDIAKGAKQRGYSAAELTAVNDIYEESMTRVHFSRRAFGLDPSPENLARMQYDFGVAREMMSRLVAGSSESGRTLNIIKKFQKNFDVAKHAEEIIKKSGGFETGEAMAAAFDQLESAGEKAAFIRNTRDATRMEQVVEAYKASLLTGLQTHAVNAISNTAFQAQNLAEETLSAGLETVRTRSSLPARELAARIYGTRQGMREGFALMKDALKHEMPEEFSKATEQTSRKFGAIGGRLGRTIRLPFRALGASDALFRTVAERQELHALAMRSAYRQGLRGKPLAEEISRLVQTPTAEMLEAAKTHGSRLVFQRELGESGKMVQHFLHKHPSAGLIVPFFRTPTNIIKEAIYRTPVGAATPEVIRMFKAGGKMRSDAVARVGLGSSMMAWVVSEALDGNVTGRGPVEPSKRSVWMQTHRPYSFKVGDEWVSYQRIEPMATIIGTAADLASLQQEQKGQDKTLGDAPGRLALIMADNMSNKTFMRGIVDFGLAVTQPQRYGQQWAESVVGGAVPFSGLLGNISRTLDPRVHEVRSVVDAAMNRIPGQRERLPVKINPVDGQEIRLGGSVGPDLASPIYSDAVRSDVLAKEMEKIGMGVSIPEKSDLSTEEFDALQREAGKSAYAEATKLIQHPFFQSLDRDNKKNKLSAIYRRHRKLVRDRIKYERRRTR